MFVKLFHNLFARAPITLVARAIAGFGTGAREKTFETSIRRGVRAPIPLDHAVSTSEFREHVRPASEFGKLEIPQQETGHRAERRLRSLRIDVVLNVGMPS